MVDRNAPCKIQSAVSQVYHRWGAAVAHMNHILWGIQILLAGAFLFTAMGKLFDYDQLVVVMEMRSKGRPIGISRLQAAGLGIVETVGAFGLLAPNRVDPRHWIAWISAVLLAMLMGCAIVYHRRRNESRTAALIFLIATLVIVVGRWPF